MERVRGVILRGDQAPGGRRRSTPERMRAVSEALVDTLVELHAVDSAGGGARGLRQARGLRASGRSTGGPSATRKARTDEVPDMERLAGLARRAPAAEIGARR